MLMVTSMKSRLSVQSAGKRRAQPVGEESPRRSIFMWNGSDQPIHIIDVWVPEERINWATPFSSPTLDEAITLANQNQGGLAAGVISGSLARAMRVAGRLRQGMVHVNDQTVNDECVNPFGGPGIAGNGTSVGGPADWEEYTQWKWITVKEQATPYPF